MSNNQRVWEDYHRKASGSILIEPAWQEPYDGRPSRTVLWEAGGEVPPVYSMCALNRSVGWISVTVRML